MNSKNTDGFALLKIMVLILGIIALGLAIFGFTQETSAKKLFTAPLAVTNSSSVATPSSSGSGDQTLASANLSTIDFNLEAYFTVFNYYPGSIMPSEFAALASSGSYSGTNPVISIQAVTTKPVGVAYDYVPAPKGCTTAAKNCLHFTLSAKDKKGNTIGQQQVSTN